MKTSTVKKMRGKEIVEVPAAPPTVLGRFFARAMERVMEGRRMLVGWMSGDRSSSRGSSVRVASRRRGRLSSILASIRAAFEQEQRSNAKQQRRNTLRRSLGGSLEQLEVRAMMTNTIFSDDFAASTGSTYDTDGAIGSSTTWNLTRLGADWGARIDGGILDLTNDAGATANVNGWVFGHRDVNAAAGWNTTLSSNTGTVTWEFNMRQIRTDPAGFGSTSYGVAYVLAGTSLTAATAGSGYAVVLGQSGSTDPVRLVSFNNGLQGTLANILTSNTAGLTDFGLDYLSARVTFAPNSNTWELFLRNDGASSFASPASGTLTSQGTAVNSTFTSTAGMRYVGGYWQGSTGATQTAFFDNVSLTVTPASGPTVGFSGAINNFTAYSGSVSAVQTFAINGTNLTDGITATAPTGFEVSSDGASFGSTATFSQSGGTASGTLSVRLAASAAVGSYNAQSIALTSTGATTVNITTSSSGNYVTPPVSAGDVALLTFNASTTDEFRFVALKPIAKDTVIVFTDSGFASSTAGVSGEGFLIFTAASNYSAGTVFSWTNGGTVSSDWSTGSGGAANAPTSFSLNAGGGDQIFMFQGPITSWATNNQPGISLIYGLQYGADFITTGPATSQTSYQPSTSMLAVANTLKFMSETALNGYYSGNGQIQTQVTLADFAASAYTKLMTGAGWFTQNTQITSYPTYTINIGPTIKASASTTAAFTTTYGSPSEVQSFTVSGGDLTANITATAPSGFEVSSDGTTYGSTAEFTQSGGTASGTLRIRLAATAPVTGTNYDSQNIVLSSTGATSVNITTAASGNAVSARGLQITGLTANNKGFDGTTSVSVTGTPQYADLANGESFSVTGTVTWAFPDANVGTNKTLTRTGSFDAPSTNYTVTQPTLTASITAVVPSAPTISGITPGNAQLSVAFTAPSSNGGANITDYKYSLDGGSFVSVGSTSSPFTIAGLTNGQTYAVRLLAVNSAGDGAISDAVNGTPAAPVNPAVTVSALSGALTTTYGSVSGERTFTVSGAALTGNLTVTAPTGIEVSTTTGASFADSLVLTATGGVVSNTTIFVRLKANAPVAGSYNSVSIAITGGGDDKTVSTPASGNSVSPKALSIIGISIADKVYDQGTIATINGTAAYDGLVNGESFPVSGTPTASFADKTVANGKAVTVSGYTAPSGNYSITQPTGFTANITAKELTIDNAAVTSKTYDGTTDATITGTLAGVISGDTVNFVGTGTFASANAGTGIAVTSTSTLAGDDAGNYSLTQPTGLTGEITKANQTITFGSLPNKTLADPAFELTATTTAVGLSVSYTSSNTSVATVSGNTVTLVGIGTTTITASQAGNENYNAAENVGQSLTVTAGPTTLSIGDITVLGFNSNAPDGFAFVPWVDVGPNTVIKFTDNGFLSGGSANAANNGRGGENFATWTNSTGNVIPAGTVITIVDGTPATTSLGSVVQKLSGISNSGDQIFVYQGAGDGTTAPNSDFGTNANPSTFTGTILFGLNFGSEWLTTGTASSNTSYRPSELAATGGSIALVTSSTSRGQYTGPRTGQTLAQYKAAVVDPANWTTATGAGTITLDATAFSIAQSQTITFNPLDAKTYGDATFELTATASSGLAVSYASSDTSVATISGSTVTIVGAGTATITASQAGGSIGGVTYAAATPVGQALTVNKKTLSITAPTIADRFYDGTTTAGSVTVGTLSGFVGTETVTATAVAAPYSSANVGTYNNVVVTYTLADGTNGGKANNYSLAPGSASGTVNTKALTIAGVTADNKVYSGTNAATLSGTPNYVGLANGETFEVSGTTSATFAQVNVGTGVAVTVTGYTAPSANYTVTQPSLSANITAAPLTITGVTADNKVYSGTNAATLSGTPSYAGLVNGETFEVSGTGSATFAQTNVGTGVAVTVTGYTAPSANYTVTQPSLSANITAAPLTISADNANKVFGTTLTSGSGSTAFSSAGLQNSETVGSVTITYGAGAAASDPVGTYVGSVTPSAATGGTFTSSNYSITYASGNIVVSQAASINVVGTLDAVSTTYGTATPTPSTVIVTGENLTGDLTVSVPSGFHVSADGTTYTVGPLTLTATSGTVSTTTIYVRLPATASVAGSPYSGNLTVSGGGATQVDRAIPASTVTAKALTITGIGIASKEYDRGTTATITGTASYSGLANGENFTVTGTPSASFADKVVANNKAVTVSGYTAPSGNYSITQPTGLTANITAKELTVTGAAVTTRAYDATKAATITGSLAGVIPGDTVNFVGTGTFASENAGTGIAVTSTSTLAGDDAGNYSLTQPTGLTGEITKAAQTITFGALPNKSVADPAFNLTATASSGLAVSYTSSNTSVATVSGNTVTMVGVGTTTITASQAGNGNYNAAANVGQSFTVTAAPTTLSVGDVSVLGFNTNGNDGFAFVTWVDLNPNTVIKFTDNGFLSSNAATAANNGRGGENFVTWTNNTGIVVLAGTVITITHGSPATTSVGSVAQSLSDIGTNGDQIFVYQGAGAGTTPSNSDFGTNANPSTFTGTMVFGLNFGSNWLSSGAAADNTSYRPSELAATGGSIALTTAFATRGQYTGARTGLSRADYKAAVVNPANWTTQTGPGSTTLSTTSFAFVESQTITFNPLDAKTYGDASFGLTATASSGLAVTYVSSNTAVATVSGSTVTIVGAGTATITASQAGGSSGNFTYTAAASVNRSLTVNAAPLTISGVTANSRAYTGTNTATLSGSPSYVGLVNGETFSVTGTPTATFAQTNVGTGIAVTVTGYTAPTSNYTLTQPSSLSANITTAPLNISGVTADNKVYSGTNAATLSGSPSYAGLVNGETFTVSGTPTATFAQTDVGTSIAVSVTGYTAPTSNYTLTQPSLSANITAAPLTITANNVNKVFGETLTGGSGSTAFSSMGLQNSETVGSVTITYGAGAAAGDPSGTYVGSVTPSAATGGTFSSSNYSITYASGNIVVSASPSITVLGTLNAVSTTYGTATATPSTVTVSGENLTGDLTLSVPSGFHVSADGTTYTVGPLTLTASGGNVATTTIYVRLPATASVASSPYSGNLIISGGGATQVDRAIPASTVAAKALTINGISIVGKTYDGTTTASIAGTAEYSGLVNGETFSVTGTPSAVFADKNVGNVKSVTVTGYTAPTTNYVLSSQPTGLTAAITPKALTVSGAFAPSRFYNASTTVTVSGGTLVGVVSGDNVTLGGSPTGSMASANVGSRKAVTVTGYTISGETTNYSLIQPMGVTVDISAARLTVYADAKSKTVGAADPTLTFTTSALVGGETIANALTGSLSRASGDAVGTYAITQGTLAAVNGNYAITFVGANFTINPAAAAGPTLTSVTLNTGDGFSNPNQRSMITSLTVTFSSPVTLAAGAFTIRNTGLFTELTGSNIITLATEQILVTGSESVYTIRFGEGTSVNFRQGTGNRGNSLADGNYRLEIDATKVSNGGGNLTGNNVFGAAAADNFFRLYGDSNGDGRVDSTDRAAINAALRSYNAAFDWDGNGSVTSGDDINNYNSRVNRRRRMW